MARRANDLATWPSDRGHYYLPQASMAPGTIGRAIADASTAGDIQARNWLMAYAHARGATIRQLATVAGLASTSTVYDAIRRAKYDAGSVFDDFVPMFAPVEVA